MATKITKYIVGERAGSSRKHLEEAGSLLEEQLDEKSAKPEKTLPDLPNELLHQILKSLYPEGVFSEHSWTIKALLHVDWLGALRADREVVTLSMTCRRFGEAAQMLPEDISRLDYASKNQRAQHQPRMIREIVDLENGNAVLALPQNLGPLSSLSIEKELTEVKRLNWQQIYNEHLRNFKDALCL